MASDSALAVLDTFIQVPAKSAERTSQAAAPRRANGNAVPSSLVTVQQPFKQRAECIADLHEERVMVVRWAYRQMAA
jgi:hypothetical protein